MSKNIAGFLWGKNAKFSYLFIAAIILLFSCLGGREIWTQEHRWADIVYTMFYYHDFLHPYLNGSNYYDKPLLSYWLIGGLSTLFGQLSTWSMRLPSAFAGLLAVWSIYRLGTYLKDKSLGLLAGWILLTTYYFIFWARTSSADMLNMAGTLFAVTWYFEHKVRARFSDYAVFFIILALTSLCKGLICPVVAFLVIFPDLMMTQEWKRHLKLRVLLAMIPAAIIYILPFWASTYFGNHGYNENGLYLVYKENILRYFQPFDHKGPIYTYFEFLPIYLLPWTLFFIPALIAIRRSWKTMSMNSKWIIWAVFLLFVFLTLSGSRRNYYVLPLVPFAILLTADWILAGAENLRRNIWSGRLTIVFLSVLFLNFGVAQPLYYAQGGMSVFAADLKQTAEKEKPWSDWKFVMLDPESKVRFYLQLSPNIKNYSINGNLRAAQSSQSLLKNWPMLANADANTNTIFVSRKVYEPQLREILKKYNVVEGKRGFGQRIFNHKNSDLPIAFIPRNNAV